jgi:hypothetical protein
MRVLLAASLALVLTACSSTSSQVTPPPAPPPIASRPPPAPEPVRDQCGAAQLQGLVGRPRSEIPIPIDPTKQRVACTTCPVTMDFSPQRLNFFFDAATGIIKEIRCG